MEDLKTKIDELEAIVKEARQLLGWKESIRDFVDRLAELDNSGRVEISILSKEVAAYCQSIELPIFLVRADLEKLGTAAQARVEESIKAFKMTE